MTSIAFTYLSLYNARHLFPITLSELTDSIRERMSATGNWYERNKIGYGEILNSRRTRPRPQPTALTGRGTAHDPFVVDTEISRPARPGKRHSDIIILTGNDDDIFPELIVKEAIPIGTHSRKTRHFRKRPGESVDDSEDEQMRPTKAVSTLPESVIPKVRRPAFRAGDRSKGYAAKCRQARLAHTIISLSSSFSQSAEALPLEPDVSVTTALSPLPSDHLLCPQPVLEDPSSSAAMESSRKRCRDIHEVRRSNLEPPQAPLLRDKKRKLTRRRNLGYAWQKTTMDSFVSRLKDIPSNRMEAAGGSAAIGVVSHTSLVIHNVSDSVMPVEHVELIGQIEHDYSCDAPPPKRARMGQTAARLFASSTLLDYDKRIADS